MYLSENPDHPLGQIIAQGKEIRLPYLEYYERLQAEYADVKVCEESLTQNFHDACLLKIRQKAEEDEHSRFGVYLQVNLQLEYPTHNYQQIPEFERVLITQYQSGSHNLKIETGRLCNPTIPRDERVCSCNTGLQTLHHCLFDCPLLDEIRAGYEYDSIEGALKLPNAAKLLIEIDRAI